MVIMTITESNQIFQINSKNATMNVESTRFQVLYKIGVLKNLAKFTRKHLCLRPSTLLKKRFQHSCFPVNFCEIFKSTFFTEHLRMFKVNNKDKIMNFRVTPIAADDDL